MSPQHETPEISRKIPEVDCDLIIAVALLPPDCGDSPALVDVLAERRRQRIGEGFDEMNDDFQDKGEMATVAACYALPRHLLPFQVCGVAGKSLLPKFWPRKWAAAWWKPTTARRDLVKAAALLLAEIERLDRRALRCG